MAPHACSIDRADGPRSGGRSGGRVKLLHLALAVMRNPQSGLRSSEWNLMTQLDAGTHTTGLPCNPGPEKQEKGVWEAGAVLRSPMGLKNGCGLVLARVKGNDALLLCENKTPV